MTLVLNLIVLLIDFEERLLAILRAFDFLSETTLEDRQTTLRGYKMTRILDDCAVRDCVQVGDTSINTDYACTS